MPKVQAKLLSLNIQDKALIGKVQFNRKAPKVGDFFIAKWGNERSLSQNALYWKYLTWLINDGGLKEQGHFDPQALHMDLKAHFLAEKIFNKGQFLSIEEGSTATLDKNEFSEYIEKVNQFMREFFEIDPSPFWSMYEKEYKI